jgi:hypothetical protein
LVMGRDVDIATVRINKPVAVIADLLILIVRLLKPGSGVS